ncbi:SDR family NAD(P)-dependent oxidoreductase [Nostoc sp.]|uniref:SDR family NAD(P)-dependent oxidoreductase n=1 Tax=Nostoc sp. TaxID=1180 RepID=UPI002FFAC1EA
MMWNSNLLQGKVALVTGSSRGIGWAIAEVFAAHGTKLYLNARTAGSLDELITQLHETYEVQAIPLYFDVSNPEEVKKGFRELFDTSKQLDIMVNNAGVLDDALIGMMTESQIDRVFGVNTFGVLYGCQYASRMMARYKSGSIINISSIIGTNGNDGQAVYGGSKAAVIGITKSLAKELAPNNIRVNVIAPGFIDTDMARSLPEDKFQERLGSIKMGRIGQPREVANVALFLASELSTYVTGQVIGVDGGMLI